MIEDRHWKALRTVHSRLEESRVEWVITGSLGMALQGVEVEVHDIDLQTDQEGAYEIERRFSDCVVTPVRYVESERIRSQLGLLDIDGVPVEIMGGLQKQLEDQTWEEPVQVGPHRRWVEIDGLKLPVLSLEYECLAYQKLGRPEKAELLRNWLQNQGKAENRRGKHEPD